MPFKVEAFQNRFLSPGQSRVDAILQVTAGGQPATGGAGSAATKGGQLVMGFIIDKSGSMSGGRIDSVKRAVWQAISMLDERSWFFVVAFDAQAQLVVRGVQATEENKRHAGQALGAIQAGGGTAMSTGLEIARQVFAAAPDAIRQAVFLTDGKNESEMPGAVKTELAACAGTFECDCWGVGTDWRVGEVQEIARALMGKASLIPEPQGIEAAFKGAMEKASAKSLKDVRLRIWTPQGAETVFVKQVNPTIDDLTGRAKVVSPQIKEYNTGAWGAGETRDFQVAVTVKPGNVNDEMLAARPSIVFLESGPSGWVEQEVKLPEARLFANWTQDDALSSRIDHHVAHYTGQDELAHAIEAGLDAREHGQEAAATQLLGKAVKLAHASNNVAMTQRLAKVVDVVDPSNGTVRLRKEVQKAAAMDLQLESRTTMRLKRSAEKKDDPKGTP
jgi:hypothetical protein